MTYLYGLPAETHNPRTAHAMVTAYNYFNT